MVNNLFGQYKHKDSVVHKLDPRLKLLYVVFISILVFTISDYSKILIFSLFVGVIILLSQVSINNLIKALKPFYLIFVFIFLMYIIFSKNKLEQGIITIWRFLMLVIMSFILTFTTTISNLITAVEKLLKPLKIFGVKLRNIAVMISIAIRFIPVMFIKLEKLKEAMLSRLANFRDFENIKIIMLALLEKMFKLAATLSDAMQSRLYNEDIESNKTLRLSKYDYLFIILILIFTLVIY